MTSAKPTLLDKLRQLEKMGEDGSLKAQQLLADIYFHGRGVPKDEEKARYWQEKIKAGQGKAPKTEETIFHLALYTSVWHGIKENPASAPQWESILAAAFDRMLTHPALVDIPDKRVILDEAKPFAKELAEARGVDSHFFNRLEAIRQLPWFDLDKFASIFGAIVVADGKISESEKECLALLAAKFEREKDFFDSYCILDITEVITAAPTESATGPAAETPPSASPSASSIGFLTMLKAGAALLILAVCAGAGYKLGLFPGGKSIFQRPTRITLMSDLLEMKEINRLYTGFYMVPVLDISEGALKRDMLNNAVPDVFKSYLPPGQKSEGAKKVVKGFCLKKYDVSVGYDNVLDLLRDGEVMRNVCSGAKDKLPDPKIIAVNPKTSRAEGKYDGACHQWDSNVTTRNGKIQAELAKESWPHIVQQSKKSLQSLASLLCN